MRPPIGRKASVLGATAGLRQRGNVAPTLSRQATAESADSHELRAQLDQLKLICHRILGPEHRHLSTLDRCLAELSKLVEDVFNVPNAFKSRAAADNRDCMEFRQTWNQPQSLPNQRDLSMNLDFFQNKIKSAPEGAFIEDMLSSWASRHDLLERHHGYIQWLFPLHKHGMSFDAVPLQVHERITISNDHECMDRFVRGYSMMLNFYGFRLTGPLAEQGEVHCCEDPSQQWKNLRYAYHNALRLTRILRCLALMDLSHYQFPLMLALLQPIVSGQLRSYANTFASYWLYSLVDKQERKCLLALVEFFNSPSRRHAFLSDNAPIPATLDADAAASAEPELAASTDVADSREALERLKT